MDVWVGLAVPRSTGAAIPVSQRSTAAANAQPA